MDVVGYLQAKGLQLKKASGDELHTACVFCSEDPSKRGRLYINVNPGADIPGLFFCHKCGAKGSLVSLKRHFGDATETQEKEDDGYIRRQILTEAAAYYHEALADNREALQWLKTRRGLGLDTIMDSQLGYADGGLYRHLRNKGYRTSDIEGTGLIFNDQSNRVIDFLRNAVTIPYHVAGNVVMIRGRTWPYKGDGYPDELDGPKYKTPPGQKSRLYRTDVTWTAEELVVTEGEFDALVLAQDGISAVAVPGAVSWQDTWDGYFANARRVYVCFDNDSAGERGRQKVTEHLGAKVRMIDLPSDTAGKVDPTTWFVTEGHSADEFRALMRRTGGGLLVTVDEAIAEHAAVQGMTGLKIVGQEHKFDLMINPGLLPAQLMILLAKTGTGKTIMLLNLFQRMAEIQPDLKILFVSLEQTRGDWWERARRIYRFFHPEQSEADAAAFWRDRIWLIDVNRINEEQLAQSLDDFIYETGERPVVAIDYLGYWAQSFRGERYERVSDAVMSAKAIAKSYRVPLLVPHQVSRMTMHGSEPAIDAARDSGVVEETADFMLPLWSPDTQHGRTMEDRTGEIKLKIGKSRHGGVGLVSEFFFAPLSLAIVPAEDSRRAQFARDELVYQTRYRSTWQEAIDRHEAGLGQLEADYRRVQRALGKKRQEVMV